MLYLKSKKKDKNDSVSYLYAEGNNLELGRTITTIGLTLVLFYRSLTPIKNNLPLGCELIYMDGILYRVVFDDIEGRSDNCVFKAFPI
jgi:hypothetical protein